MRLAFALAALLAASPAVAETITFEPGTFSLSFESATRRVWTTGNFTASTSLSGAIASGFITDADIQMAYQRPASLVELLSFDVRGTGELRLQNFDESGTQNINDQPFTAFEMTGGWQTITLDPAQLGFLVRLSADTVFDADNFVYGSNAPMPGMPGIPEPATWALMILGFGAIGSFARLQRKGKAEPQAA